MHKSSGTLRGIADICSWSFMQFVKIFGIKPPYDKAPLTIVSHKYKFIYIGIPKVATRSFADAFYHQGKDIYDSEMFETKREYQRVLKRYPDYFKFSFIRHPFDRILSCYNSKIGHEDLSLLKKARIMSFYKNLYPGMSFEEFAQWLNTNEGQDQCADRHWMSQHEFLHNNGVAITNALGRYETLNEDLSYIMQKVGAPCPDLKQKGWISKDNKYEDQISEEAKKELTERYQKDFKTFGYKA